MFGAVLCSALQSIVPGSPGDFTVECRGGKGREDVRRFVVTAPRAPSGGLTAAAATHYEVQMDGAGAVRTVALGTSVDFPHEDPETKRVPHTFRVRAVNAAGAGPWSEAKAAKRHTGVGPHVERAHHVVTIVINVDRCVHMRMR